jgi:hypothetical protein
MESVSGSGYVVWRNINRGNDASMHKSAFVGCWDSRKIHHLLLVSE